MVHPSKLLFHLFGFQAGSELALLYSGALQLHTTRRFIQVCAVYFDLPLWTLFSFNLDLSWMQMKMVLQAEYIKKWK